MLALSIDIETTGLKPSIHGVTEFAAILFDTNNPSKTLVSFERWLDPEGYVWSNYCLKLHKDWIARVVDRLFQTDALPITDGLMQAEPPIVQGLTGLWHDFSKWLTLLGILPVPGSRNRIVPAGKNFGSFDQQFLIHGGFPEIFRHRTADWVPFYQRKNDAFPPELKLCKERAIAMGCPDLTPDVAHRAYDDALDVVKLIQFAYKDMPE